MTAYIIRWFCHVLILGTKTLYLGNRTLPEYKTSQNMEKGLMTSTKAHRKAHKAIGPSMVREYREGRDLMIEPQFLNVRDGEDLPQETESSLWGCRKTKRTWSPRRQGKNVEGQWPTSVLLIEGRWGLRTVLWIWQHGLMRNLDKRSFMGWGG